MSKEIKFENGRRAFTDNEITPKLLTEYQEQFGSKVIEVGGQKITKSVLIKAKQGMKLTGPGSRQKNLENKDIDDYLWYVVHVPTSKVEGGYEFKEDAKELISDFSEPSEYKVVSKRTLKQMGIANPNEEWKHKADTGTKVGASNFEDWLKENKISVYKRTYYWVADDGGGDYRHIGQTKAEVMKALKEEYESKYANGGGVGRKYRIYYDKKPQNIVVNAKNKDEAFELSKPQLEKIFPNKITKSKWAYSTDYFVGTDENKIDIGSENIAKRGKKLTDNQISEETFDSVYKPQINHIQRANHGKSVADEDICSFGGTMYETYGKELDYIRELANSGKQNHIWTILDEDGNLVISSGLSLVNRVGYIVTEKPWEKEWTEVVESAKRGTKTDESQIDLFANSGVKYRAEVGGIGENVWSGNAMEYDTEEEAKDWLRGLASRWYGYNISRVVPTSTITNEPIDLGDKAIFQNYRKNAKGNKIRTNAVAVRELISDLEKTPHAIGLGLLRERLIDHAQSDYDTSKAHPETFQNPIFSVGMYQHLFERIGKELDFESGKNNTKAVKDLVKNLADTPHEVGLALFRERLIHWAKQDQQMQKKNPSYFANPMFNAGMYEDLFTRIIKFCDFTRAKEGMKTDSESEKVQVSLYKWGEYENDEELDLIDLPLNRLTDDQLLGFDIRSEDRNKTFYASENDIDEDDDGTSVKYAYATTKAYKLGGGISGLLSKAKELGTKGVKGAKKGYAKAKDKTNEAIRDKKRQIAYEVIQETRNKVPNSHEYKSPMKQSSLMKEAGNMVDEYYKGGGSVPKGKGFMVFNYTDNIYASPNIFSNVSKANQFIAEFRKRFEMQGYYKDNNWNKIAPKDIDLLAIPADFNPMKKN